MSFGQTSGPPASQKQTAYLLSLMEAAGYDFATGRHHFGLTQRQARGKFTIGEASELIERLTAEAEIGPDGEPIQVEYEDPAAKRAQARLDKDRSVLLKGIPAEMLANELESRGWAIIPPT
ncbi:MAG: hypothetical protein ABIR32_20240 [Ilumatobacteraceae bacterium]